MKYVVNEMAKQRGYKKKDSRIWFGVLWLALLVCIALYISLYVNN